MSFDPDPTAPYAECRNCDVKAATQDDAQTHMKETTGQGEGNRRSHSLTITNPDRPKRIQSRMSSIVDNAITGAMEYVDRMVDRGEITEAEASSALSSWPDFQDFRTEWVNND